MIKIENRMEYYFDNTNIPVPMTKKGGESISKATECWLSNQPFTPLSLATKMNEKDCGKVTDHCHLTAKYPGAAQNACNSNSK